MAITYIRRTFRIVLLIAIAFLFIKNILLAILLGDIESIPAALIHAGLFYLVFKNHRFAYWAIHAWAVIYLLVFTGIKAGAKSLIILRGDSWEIDSTRYYIDLFLVVVGILVLVFDRKIFAQINNGE